MSRHWRSYPNVAAHVSYVTEGWQPHSNKNSSSITAAYCLLYREKSIQFMLLFLSHISKCCYFLWRDVSVNFFKKEGRRGSFPAQRDNTPYWRMEILNLKHLRSTTLKSSMGRVCGFQWEDLLVFWWRRSSGLPRKGKDLLMFYRNTF